MKLKFSNLKAMREEQVVSQRQVAAAVLFADICGSTRLFEKYGDRRARQIETRVLDVLTSGTVAHDGVVIKTIGDEIMSRFASAQQAVSAACEMHRALKEDKELAELNIAVKIGLHYGPVLVEKGDLFGDAVNVDHERVAFHPDTDLLPRV